MLFDVYRGCDRGIGFESSFKYEWGLKEIESARKNLKRRNVEERVIKDLDSIQEFWSSNNLLNKGGDSNPYNVLNKSLAYFLDERRTKFSDSEEKVQKLLDKLRECVIEEKDLEVIKEFEHRNDPVTGIIMTAEEFLDDIDYGVRLLEIKDRYLGGNHEKEISRYQFVKDAVKKFGISDSYPAEVLYKKMIKSLISGIEKEKGVPDIVLELEAYRCIAKGSTDTLEALLEKFGHLE